MSEVVNIAVVAHANMMAKVLHLRHTHRILDALAGVSEMVTGICSTLVSGTKKVLGELFILSHGERGVVDIGRDRVSDSTFSSVAGQLGRVVPFVRWGMTRVRLDGCEAGAGEQGLGLLNQWSDLWGGVPVSAGISIQIGGGEVRRTLGWEGTVRTVANGQLKTYPGPYWDSISRPLHRLCTGGTAQKTLALELIRSSGYISRVIDPYS